MRYWQALSGVFPAVVHQAGNVGGDRFETQWAAHHAVRAVHKNGGERTEQGRTGFSPRASLVYQPLPFLALRGDLAGSFRPNTGFDRAMCASLRRPALATK